MVDQNVSGQQLHLMFYATKIFFRIKYFMELCFIKSQNIPQIA